MHCQQIIQFGKPLEARDYPTPEPKGTEVLLNVTACGVCHSDLHIWEGFFDLGGGQKMDLLQRMKLPFTLVRLPRLVQMQKGLKLATNVLFFPG